MAGRPSKYTDEAFVKAIDHTDGSIPSVAAWVGCSVSTAQIRLAALGLTPNSRGRPTSLTDAQCVTAAKTVASGQSVVSVSLQYGVTTSTAVRSINRGIEIMWAKITGYKKPSNMRELKIWGKLMKAGYGNETKVTPATAENIAGAIVGVTPSDVREYVRQCERLYYVAAGSMA